MREFIVNIVFESENENFLSDELHAVKSALLFADKVSISSGRLSLGVSLDKTYGAGALHQLVASEDLIGEAIKKLARIEDEAITAPLGSKSIEVSRKEVALDILNDFDHFVKNADENYFCRIAEFNSLIDKGLVSCSGKDYDLTQPLDSGVVVRDHIESIISGLTNPSTFNMYNKDLGEFLHYLHHQSNYTDPQISNIKYTRLLGNLLAGIPGIGEAKVDEIIDIRKALTRPIIKFRSAVFDFSDQIASAPWDKDFETECKRLYHQKVAPALSEIAQGLEDNSVPKNIFTSGKNKVADLVGSIMSGNVAKILKILSESVVEGFSSKERKLAKENSFYFLYEVERKLK